MAKTELRQSLGTLAKHLGYAIESQQRLQKLESDERKLALVEALKPELAARFIPLIKSSNSQLLQDIFVLAVLNLKRSGYFVEFGACDGIFCSNSLILERDFHWTGILAEPAQGFHSRLIANRQCSISTDCVWSKSGEELLFNEVNGAKVLSTINELSGSDYMSPKRADGIKYKVKTISLNDLLKQFKAPANIDYLSLDTEGSELEILRKFDFEMHAIKVITVEHNYTRAREDIFKLLTNKGFKRVLEDISAVDDWYVHQDHLGYSGLSLSK